MARELISFDWAIKKILRNKVNFDILEGFLSELLKDEIKIIEILESKNNKKSRENNFNYIDLKVKGNKHDLIIIVLQYEIDFFSRILLSSSNVISEQLDENKAYSNIPKIIIISILYTEIGGGDDYIYHGTTQFKGIHNHHVLKLKEKEKEYYESNQFFNISPEHYLIKLGKFDKTIKNSLDEWIYFLTTTTIRNSFTAKGIKKAQKSLDVLQFNEKERWAYNRYHDGLHYQASMLESSYYAGIRAGMIKGKKWIEIGKKEGVLMTAKTMKQAGMDAAVIAQMTGLSIEEIGGLS